MATATHGSGVANGNLATAVAGLELVTSDGELVRVSRGDPDFDGMVVGLGALGAVTRITLDVQPAYEVRQRVFEGLRWAALAGELRRDHGLRIQRQRVHPLAGDRRPGLGEEPRSTSRSAPERPLRRPGAATADRHPILGIDPAPATPQLGRPGPWHDRLPHFRMGFTPSAGEELQSEYLLPRDGTPSPRSRRSGPSPTASGRCSSSPRSARWPPTGCG